MWRKKRQRDMREMKRQVGNEETERHAGSEETDMWGMKRQICGE